MDQNNQKLAKEWFDSANSDFLYAKIGLKQKQIFPQVAFLSQQIAEKYLKGFMVLNGAKPPRVHELPKLLYECIRINSRLEVLQDACEILSGFYIETRYPPDMPEYSKAELADAFAKARKIKEIIDSEIKNQL
jgi:HEPN domain-containing protein